MHHFSKKKKKKGTVVRCIDPGGVAVKYNEAINTWGEVKAMMVKGTAEFSH